MSDLGGGCDVSGKYFTRFHSLQTNISRIAAREKLEDELNEIANHENALLISTNMLIETEPILLLSIWLWN